MISSRHMSGVRTLTSLSEFVKQLGRHRQTKTNSIKLSRKARGQNFQEEQDHQKVTACLPTHKIKPAISRNVILPAVWWERAGSHHIPADDMVQRETLVGFGSE